MPPARPTKSPPPQRPKGTPSKAAGKAKAGKATDASVAASESDDEVDSEPAAANGQASSSASSKSPAKAAAKGSKAPSAVKAKAAAAAPSAPAAKAAPATIGAVLVLFLALAAGAYTVLAPGKLKPVPKLGPNAFDGLNLKLSGGHTGVAMVGFTDKSCSGCKKFNRVLKQAATQGLLERLQGQSLKIGKVDCDKHDDLCTRFGVTGDEADATGTPQLLWFRNGTFVGAYEGEHDAKAIKTWAAQKGSADVDAGAE